MTFEDCLVLDVLITAKRRQGAQGKREKAGVMSGLKKESQLANEARQLSHGRLIRRPKKEGEQRKG